MMNNTTTAAHRIDCSVEFCTDWNWSDVVDTIDGQPVCHQHWYEHMVDTFDAD